MVQHSLIVMLELMEKGQITLENIVDKMCHAPADIFHVEERGYLREGYKADIAIFEKHPWTVKKENFTLQMRLVTSRRNVFYLPGKHDVSERANRVRSRQDQW